MGGSIYRWNLLQYVLPLALLQHTYNQRQKLWKKLLFGQFCVSTLFPLLTMLRNNDQKLRQAMLWVRNIVKGKRGNFKHIFRNFHYIFTLIVWNLQKEKKNEVLCMLFQKPQMCFNELDYVTVHFVMNIMTSNSVKNDIKTTTIMFSSYYYLALVEKGLLQAHSGKCCSLDRLWCICFCCFILPNHG